MDSDGGIKVFGARIRPKFEPFLPSVRAGEEERDDGTEGMVASPNV